LRRRDWTPSEVVWVRDDATQRHLLVDETGDVHAFITDELVAHIPPDIREGRLAERMTQMEARVRNMLESKALRMKRG